MGIFPNMGGGGFGLFSLREVQIMYRLCLDRSIALSKSNENDYNQEEGQTK